MESTLRVRIDGRQAIREGRRLESSLDRVSRRGDGLTRVFGGVGRVLGTVMGSVLAVDFTRTINETERLMGSLTTMTGSAHDAGRAFSALEQFAKTTPYTLDQSVRGFIKMKSLGLEPTANAMTSFGNTASAMGKDLNDMIEAVADASTMEFERLKEFGIKARQEGDNVSFTFNGVTTTVRKNSEEIVEYLQSIGNTKFADAMADQMDRLPGKLSNLRDNIQGLWRAIGDAGATQILKDAIDDVSAFVGNLTEAFQTGYAQNLIKAHIDVFVQPFLQSLDAIQEYWDKAVDGMAGKFEWFTGLFDKGFWATLVDGLTILPTAWQKAVEAMLEIGGGWLQRLKIDFELISEYADYGWELVKSGAAAAWEAVKIQVASLMDWIVDQFVSMGERVTGVLGSMGFGGMAGTVAQATAALRELGGAEARLREEQARRQDATRDSLDLIGDRIEALQAEQLAIKANAEANASAAILEIAAELDQLEATRALLQAQAEATKTGEDWRDVLDRLATSGNNAAESTENLAEAEAKAAKEREKLVRSYRALERQLDPVTAAMKDMVDAEELLHAAFDRGIISHERLLELLEELPEAFRVTSDESDAWTTALERGIERLDDLFADLWRDLLDGSADAFDKIKDWFKDFLAEMAHAAITRPIMVGISTAIGGANGEGGGLGGQSATGFLQSIGSLFGYGEGGFSWEGFKESAGGLALGAAAGMYGGNAIGSMIDDSNRLDGPDYSGIGSSVGAMIGAIWGPIGSMIGGLIGGLAGGAFGKFFGRDFEGGLGGTGASGVGAEDDRVQTELGTIVSRYGRGGFGHTNDPGSFFAELAPQLQDFDAAIAQMLDPEQMVEVRSALENWEVDVRDPATAAEDIFASRLETILSVFDAEVKAFVQQGEDLESQLGRFGAALALEKVVDQFEDILGDYDFATVLATVDLMRVGTEDWAATVERFVNEMAKAQAAIGVLDAYTDTDLAGDFKRLVEARDRTLFENAALIGDEMDRVMNEFDGSLDMLYQLADVSQQMREAELQMLLQIESVFDGINNRISSLRDMIVSDLSTPEQNYDRMRAEAEALADSMRFMTDPAEIDAAMARIDQLTRSAYGMLSEDQRGVMGPEFLSWLDSLQEIADERRQAIESDALAAANARRDRLDEIMEGVADPLILVAEKHGVAADELLAAATNLRDATSPGHSGPVDPVSPGGPGQGDENMRPHSAGEVGAAVQAGMAAGSQALAEAARQLAASTSNAAVSEQQAAAIIAQAIASIPGRIVVVPPTSEFS